MTETSSVWRIVVPAFALLVLAATSRGQEVDSSAVHAEIEALRRRLDELEREVGGASRDAGSSRDAGDRSARASESGAEPGATSEGSGVSFSPFWQRDALETPPTLRGVYDKPFLASLWRRAYVGGYTELEYHSFEDGIQGIPRGFRMHRTNLFLFTDITQQVRFGGEIEFETEFDGGDASSEIEVAVEMAFVDWVIFEELALRGGVILPPLGRINVNHDGPARELTERPLVSTFVIPTTLSEPGLGVHGSFGLGSAVDLGYEAYVVNGFSVLDGDGQLAVGPNDTEQLLRESRSALGGDDNDGVATTGRIALGLLDLLELGGSWHFGAYDERGDNFLTILAGDLGWSWWIFSAEGEIAVADFERDGFARAAGTPGRFWGWYGQLGLGGMPDVLRDVAPFLFGGEGARLGLALRFDWIDIDGDRGEVIEPGVTFRPVADTVFKLSWRFTPNSFGTRGVPGREDFDDEGLSFSISTYF